MNQKKIEDFNSRLQNRDEEYSFRFYPENSLKDGMYQEVFVREISAKTAKQALIDLFQLKEAADRASISKSYLEQFYTYARLPTNHERLGEHDLFEYILADLYRWAYVDRHQYYVWKLQVNGLMAFDFRGYNENSALLRFAHNHRKNTTNLEPHRHSAKKFLSNFKKGLRDFYGISGEGIIIKDMITAGFIEKIHVKQSRYYRRGPQWSY